ncbi:MAG: hypothetical protein ACFFCZ_18445 [Promethearchaeota archaeon]
MPITRGITEDPIILFEGQRSVPVGTYDTVRFYSFFQYVGVGWSLDPSLQAGTFGLELIKATECANYSAGQTYSFVMRHWQEYNQTTGRHYASMYTMDMERDTEYALMVNNTRGSETLVISLKIVGGSSEEELRALLEPMVRNYVPFSLPSFLLLAISTGGGVIVIDIRRRKKHQQKIKA